MTRVQPSTSPRTSEGRPSESAKTGISRKDSEASGKGRQLIVTGDDYGDSSDVNRAIISAHRQGILTSASLMVNGAALEEAVECAHATPTLAVGLHLALSISRSTLPPQEIPALVNHNGQFLDNPASAGCVYYFRRGARVQLEREIRAQVEKFLSTKLTLDHVDGHQHLHLHPTIFPMLVRICDEYRVPAIRVIREDLGLNLKIDRSRLISKLALSITFALLGSQAQRTLENSLMRTADRVLGLLQDGRMEKDYLQDVLPQLPSGVTEIYCHPSLAAATRDSSASRLEYEALIDPVLRAAVSELGIQLTSYAKLL